MHLAVSTINKNDRVTILVRNTFKISEIVYLYKVITDCNSIKITIDLDIEFKVNFLFAYFSILLSKNEYKLHSYFFILS